MKTISYKFTIPYYKGIGTIATKNPIIRQFAMLEIQALTVKEIRDAVKLGYSVVFKGDI